MQFEELNEEEFQQLLAGHPLRTFIQTPEMARVRQKLGYQAYYVGVKKDGKLLAATMMGARKTHFGFYEFYAPRGLLVDYEDKELLSFFTKSLKKYIQKKKGYVLRIDPYYITKERDIDGKIVPNGIDHSLGIQFLKEVGFQKSNRLYQQFSLMFSMNLEKSAEETFRSFKTLPKRMIKKASHLPIEIREATYEELELVKNLIDETGDRKHFKGRNLEYYQHLYEEFHPKGKIKFLLGELDVKAYEEERRNTLQTLKREMETLQKEEKKQEWEEKIQKEEHLLEECKQMQANQAGKVLLSAGVFLLCFDELVYLFGGNKKEYLHLGSSYFMQWTMIQYGLEHHFTKYNFYGISQPSLEDGVYTFKRGFGGYVEELIGDYELPIRSYYYFDKFIKKIKCRE